MRPVVHEQTVVEYFQGLVDEALDRQRVAPLDLTRYYLVQLLSGFARVDASDASGRLSDEPLAVRLTRALEAVGARQRHALRALADDALFVSGFFSDSLQRSVVDIDYYATLGGFAYQQLGQWDSDTLAPAYAELGGRFLAFADVLGEVSEQSAMASDASLLRLYERWVTFGSARHGERLLRKGIVPTREAIRARDRIQ
jgi:hypothetical protein